MLKYDDFVELSSLTLEQHEEPGVKLTLVVLMMLIEELVIEKEQLLLWFLLFEKYLAVVKGKKLCDFV